MTLRVANLMLGAGRGGLEQAAIDFAEALRSQNQPCQTITVGDAWANAGLDAAGLPRWTLRIGGPLDFAGPWRLRDHLLAFQPTHVLCHGNRALKLATHSAVRAALPGTRIVAITHNYSLKHAHRADQVLALTADLARAAREAGVGPDRLSRISNLVRVPEALPAARASWRAPPVIGSLGRFVAKKGFEVFIEAVALLRDRGIRCRAVLAGTGEEERVLKALASAHGLGEILSFPGWVEDRQAFYDSLDIAVVPSHHEPFGIVVLEAMAEGLPVVATASEGPSEILADGRGGRLVPLRDPVAMADALAALLADPDGARALGRTAHQLALSTYDLEPTARRLVSALGAMT